MDQAADRRPTEFGECDEFWCRNPGALTRTTPRSIVISTEKAPAPLSIRGVAMLVWLSLEGVRSTGELSARLEEAGIPANLAHAETRAALRELVEIGAVVAR